MGRDEVFLDSLFNRPPHTIQPTNVFKRLNHLVQLLTHHYHVADSTIHRIIALYDPAYHIVLCPNGFGEIEWAHRLHAAARDLGWTSTLFLPSDNIFANASAVMPPIDMVIYMRDPVKRAGLSNRVRASYLAVSDCSREWMCTNAEALRGFDGVLSAAAVNLCIMADILCFHLPTIRWFPSCLSSSCFSSSSSSGLSSSSGPFTTVFYCGTQWDARRTSYPFERLYGWLDQHGLLKVYGPEQIWRHKLPNSWCGLLKADRVVNAISECGIALVLHSEGHMRSGAPTSRIFESAAANAVIISDRHPFVVKHFSHCVLFLDEQLPASLEQQMQQHLQWIHTHPIDASRMVHTAHLIANQWNLFHQLDALANFHSSLIHY